ncbi:MAG: DUF2851 family protein, partial [Crocinitomicaceae bacterium]|nr:DUF2851 family protein [Crocinitomicaceae bacterium]
TMGAIRLDDLTFHGAIEIHIKSSDWYAHKHHLDDNYNNVVLHVVYEHDKEVYQAGRKLPTLELKEYIDKRHFFKYKQGIGRQNELLCANELSNIDSIHIISMMEKALVDRLNGKVRFIRSLLLSNEESELLYYFIAAAFGTHVNKNAFLELARRVPRKALLKLNVSQRYKLLLSESGLLSGKGEAMTKVEQWHFKGNRPSNFPTVRIRQFAALIERMDVNTSLLYSSPQALLDSMHLIFDKANLAMEKGQQKLTTSFKNHLIINAVVPFVWLLGEQNCSERCQEQALSLLELIPAEENALLRKWKKYGVIPSNAYQSQALIGLYRDYCCRKKCLSCAVGNKVLNRL